MMERGFASVGMHCLTVERTRTTRARGNERNHEVDGSI